MYMHLQYRVCETKAVAHGTKHTKCELVGGAVHREPTCDASAQLRDIAMIFLHCEHVNIVLVTHVSLTYFLRYPFDTTSFNTTYGIKSVAKALQRIYRFADAKLKCCSVDAGSFKFLESIGALFSGHCEVAVRADDNCSNSNSKKDLCGDLPEV
jgi:hypothetical protein